MRLKDILEGWAPQPISVRREIIDAKKRLTSDDDPEDEEFEIAPTLAPAPPLPPTDLVTAAVDLHTKVGPQTTTTFGVSLTGGFVRVDRQ